MRTYATFATFAALLALAACDKDRSSEPGTTVTIDATSKDGDAVKASADGATGAVNVDLPGFKANIDLPKLRLDADNFEMNGAKLYPGSKIDNLAIKGSERGKGEDEGAVHVRFTAPADFGTVKGWFAKEWAARPGVTVKDRANGISGTGPDNGSFAVSLENAGGGKTRGVLVIQGKG